MTDSLPAGMDAAMSLDEVMRRWPATIAIVMRHRMLCVGCPIGAFHTLADACREHGVGEAALLREIEAAIAG